MPSGQHADEVTRSPSPQGASTAAAVTADLPWVQRGLPAEPGLVTWAELRARLGAAPPSAEIRDAVRRAVGDVEDRFGDRSARL